jgi:protein-L-isoaspartate(D-aspartate) O-methyltransferase
LHEAHRVLLEHIDEQMRAAAGATGVGRLSARVRAALAGVDRAAFVRGADRADAYRDRPLPIGHGQTISQPFIVALMTELLAPQETDAVLEVGTGCGYQTAVLAELVSHVHSVEVVPALASAARARLADLGYANVSVHEGDGNAGWEAGAPYDGILVTAAAREVPEALGATLAPGGRLVRPVGPPGGVQDLVVVTKDEDGSARARRLLPVAFVPLVGPD